MATPRKCPCFIGRGHQWSFVAEFISAARLRHVDMHDHEVYHRLMLRFLLVLVLVLLLVVANWKGDNEGLTSLDGWSRFLVVGVVFIFVKWPFILPIYLYFGILCLLLCVLPAQQWPNQLSYLSLIITIFSHLLTILYFSRYQSSIFILHYNFMVLVQMLSDEPFLWLAYVCSWCHQEIFLLFPCYLVLWGKND